MKAPKLVLILPFFLLLLAAGASAQTTDALYQAAKQEGVLNLYGGGPARIYTVYTEQFEKEYPGVKVNVVGGFSNTLTDRIDAEMKGGKSTADVTTLQTIQSFVRWKKEGKLLLFKPEGFDQVPDAFKDPEGYYHPDRIGGIVFGYNPGLVPKDQIPKNYADFLKPAWKGRIISTYPQTDDITLYLYYHIVQKYGWRFMEELMKLEPAFVDGHTGVNEKIFKGERSLTFDAIIGQTTIDKLQKRSIELAFGEEPFPVWAQTTAIFRGAPHPNAAKLYVTWALSRPVQIRKATTGYWSGRKDVPPAPGIKPLGEYRIHDGFREFITNDERVEKLRAEFGKHIKYVKGVEYR